jgi:hypothetical protein
MPSVVMLSVTIRSTMQNVVYPFIHSVIIPSVIILNVAALVPPLKAVLKIMEYAEGVSVCQWKLPFVKLSYKLGY